MAEVPPKANDQDAADVLAFWFEEIEPKAWFTKDTDFDRRVTERFGAAHARAAAGELDHWQERAEGALALVLLLDQFPRNMFRDSPRAFASDAGALAVAKQAIVRGLDMELVGDRRIFLYMPFQHSEELADQRRSVELFAERLDSENMLGYARRHLAIIERFGRFPHRNAVLGRANTPEEAEFLEEKGSSF